MATTRDEIREWLDRAKKKGATHMIVATDTFDWEDYPVFVMPGQDAQAEVNARHGPNMSKVMEVYNMSMDLDEQLKAQRVWNVKP